MTGRRDHILVMAKAPVPGRVKTRLCPPCTPTEAAAVAAAALSDTLEAVGRSGAKRRLLALDGEPGEWLPEGFDVIPQRGATFNDRLEAAWAAADGPGLQIAMDTPQVSAEVLDGALDALHAPGCDAVLGPAFDDGWWAIGLHGPIPGLFLGIPMSCETTGRDQQGRLTSLGLRWTSLRPMRDIDHFDDVAAVAAAHPRTRTAATFREIVGSLATQDAGRP